MASFFALIECINNYLFIIPEKKSFNGSIIVKIKCHKAKTIGNITLFPYRDYNFLSAVLFSLVQ